MWVRALAAVLVLVGLGSPAHASAVDDLYAHWQRAYLVPAGEGQLRVALARTGPQREQTVSEGQGYGMLITVALGTRDQFDALWRFSRAHPSALDPRLMDWKVPETGGDASAFDGDADMAFALILADRRWGGDYLRDAQDVIAGLAQSAVGPRSRLPLLGDWVLHSDSRYTQWQFRSSDCMPANFAAFGSVSRPAFWRSVTRACVKALATQSRATGTGLVSDFLRTKPRVRAVSPGFLEGATDGQYNYNAGRVPWRLAQGDAKAQAVATRISAWARQATGGDPLRLAAGYTLTGQPLADYFTSFFAAPVAVAASTAPGQRRWERSLMRAVRDQREDYYEDSVTLLCLLTIRGAFERV